MAGLVFDEKSLVDSQVYKYKEMMRSRVNIYTGDGRVHVTYYNINDEQTTIALGTENEYGILSNDSPIRYNRIKDMILLNFSPLQPEDGTVSNTTVKEYDLNGTFFIPPGTIQPKENDMFCINQIDMNHIFRITKVTQDGLTTDGSYRAEYTLFDSNPDQFENLERQTVKEYILDRQTIGGDDLTPVITTEDHTLRSRIMTMIQDMVENYTSRFYDSTHNCFLLHLNGRTLFDPCGNMFMAKHGLMIQDQATRNIVLNENKLNIKNINELYQMSPFKWIERDAPIRYIEKFKYMIKDSTFYPDSSFHRYGLELEIMEPIPGWGDPEYIHEQNILYYFPQEVYEIFNQQKVSFKESNHDYVSIIYNFIHGNLTKLEHLSLYTGDQLFDNSLHEKIYLWTPMILYILKYVLKFK